MLVDKDFNQNSGEKLLAREKVLIMQAGVVTEDIVAPDWLSQNKI